MTVKFTIDGRTVEVPEGLNIILAAKRAGIDIPHFCYHPYLSVAGNCRMCIVEIEKMPKPCIACGHIVQDGMVVHTNTDMVKKIRKGIMEFLLINHPLDCPICDQAGECKLQEYYMLYDCEESRFNEQKETKEKVIDLGSMIMLDRERCIACTRCVRFFEEFVGDAQLTLRHRSDHAEITTFNGKPLDSIYSSNIADTCPVGALTSKDFRFKCRVWFLKSDDSVCPGCARGCNIKIQHNDGVIYRIMPRMTPDINKFWMCDVGRLTYKRYQGNERLTKPLVLRGQRLEVTILEEAIEELLESLRKLAKDGSANVAGVASAELTSEDASAFKSFMGRVGADKVFLDQGKDTPGFEDDILIRADRNPNTAGLKKLGIEQPVDELDALISSGKVNVLFIAAGYRGKIEDIIKRHKDKLKLVTTFAYNESDLLEGSDVILPTLAWPELKGTFTNFERVTQEISPALAPKGDALSIKDIVSQLEAQMERKAIAVA